MISELRTSVGVLAANVVTTFHVDWFSYAHHLENSQLGLEDVFKLAYGKPMEMLESPNDTDYSIDVVSQPLSEFDRLAVQKCVNNGSFECYRLRLLMQDLAFKKVIPAGAYVVTVSW